MIKAYVLSGCFNRRRDTRRAIVLSGCFKRVCGGGGRARVCL